MTIIEALKKGSGKIRRGGWDLRTVLVVENGAFSIYLSDGERIQDYKLPYYELMSADWLPYEPEKCEACRQADEWDRIHHNQSDLAQHYRDYHCTCKKEAP